MNLSYKSKLLIIYYRTSSNSRNFNRTVILILLICARKY
nr:MAG TPA: hypothetical protein [Bacteriophage sp.]